MKSSNFVMNIMDRELFEILGICLLYHVDRDSAFTSFICKMVSLATHENDEIYI